MTKRYGEEWQSRLDKERACLIHAGIGLDRKSGGWTHAVTFLLESGIPDDLIARALREAGPRRGGPDRPST